MSAVELDGWRPKMINTNEAVLEVWKREKERADNYFSILERLALRDDGIRKFGNALTISKPSRAFVK